MTRAADQVANAGSAFGANLREATEDMADASGFAGPGMAHKHMADAFEFMLEKAEDELRFFPDRADAARTLFCAKARIAFYGLQSTEAKRKAWKRLADDAYAELSEFDLKAA